MPGQTLSAEDRAKVVQYVNGLVIENYWRQNEFNLWDRAQTNMELFLYGRARNRPVGRYRANRIKTAVRSNVAIQGARRPKATVRLRATGSPPVWYFNGAAAGGALADMPSQDEPLEPQHVAQLQDMIMESAARATATGQPPTVSPDILVRIDDAMIRSAAQLIVDAKFDLSNGLFYFRENLLYNAIIGYQFMKQSWDDDTCRAVFRNFEPVTVYLDTSKTDIREMGFLVADEFMGKFEALEHYKSPAMQAAIERHAAAGIPTLAGSIPYRLPTYWLQRTFYREVIIIRTAWIRHQRYPLTPDEAAERGYVLRKAMTAEDALAKGLVKQAAAQPVQEGVPTEPQVPAYEMADGTPIQPGAAEWPTRHVNPETLEEMDPTKEGWPTRTSIRQIVIVAGEVAEDRECEHLDIPFHQNVNTEIPFSPYGQGEPEQLERLQEAYNNCLTDIVVNGEYVTTPCQITTKEVIKQNPTLVGNAYIKPGTIYVVDSQTWLQLGGDRGTPLIQTMTPPAAPADQWRREDMLSRRITELSDQSAALRGEAPTDQASGRMVEALQSAGASSIHSKGWRSEPMLSGIFRQLLTDTLSRQTPEQLAAEFPKYSVPIWKELHRRLVEHYLFSMIDVETSGGGQAARENRAALLANAKRGGIPVSDPEILEALDLDPREQIEKQADFNNQAAAAGAVMQPGNGGAVEQPPGKATHTASQVKRNKDPKPE